MGGYRKTWELLNVNELYLKDLEPQILGKVEDGVTIHGPVHLGKTALLEVDPIS